MDFLKDPHWYKDAVIYELHVRSFFDANNDGYGDFAGLREKLPYLERLGVNTLWLLPFLDSPLKDDGYDTADYYTVLPVHGDLDDFKAFLDEAHERGMRVITELVLNHTSDQHPWFQEARNPDSPKHDWYVWSETDDTYNDVRIIFTDTEVSNWSWDQQARKYYWHRFFSHQPDLNYDNPEVRETMKEVMFFWLDMGIDGLRLDAVPYLFEREGTTCENLPETIDYIVELRQAIEERYGPGKVLLAEANQWPEDTLPYFADGEGVQMAFNFPIMPRMYMALRRADRRPLVEMLKLTEDIPEDTQWAVFLRNHDELTLEMVTDEERDYMNNAYASDPRFRINVGIRRRLAPLLEGERRQIELMNALLLSLKGSPILYYGDEIGMGDDPFLGDRNGVRTPMQWAPDKNGGFSRAAPHRLFMPSIDRGRYSYEFVNVEDAESDAHSLLHFMRRLIGFRNQHAQVFGRGSMEILDLENPAVLAFIREHEGTKILVVANLSGQMQSCHLPVRDDLQGLVPVEMGSRTAMPPLGDTPYHLPLGPHGFFWFTLEPAEALAARALARPKSGETPSERPAESALPPLPSLRVREGVQNLLVPTLADKQARAAFERMLPSFIRRQRWFGAKDCAILDVRIADAVRIVRDPWPVYLSILDVTLKPADGPERRDTYLLPLAVRNEEGVQTLLLERPHAALTWLDLPEQRVLLYDAAVGPDFWLGLFRWWTSGTKGRSLRGTYTGDAAEVVRRHTPKVARPLAGEQSNSAAILDGQFFVKLYRRLEQGVSPEVELLGHLTGSSFPYVPALLGTITFTERGQDVSMGVIQQALPVDSDGWTFATDLVERFLGRIEGRVLPAEPAPLDAWDRDNLPPWLETDAPEMAQLARTLGIRTAEMHQALATGTSDTIRPEPGIPEGVQGLIDRVTAEMQVTRTMLAEQAASLADTLPFALPSDADWARLRARLDRLMEVETTREKIRIHGDYHLGQTLIADGDLYVLDFEGEPARSLDERRARDYAVRDVAGMLRSLEYAAYATLGTRMGDDDLRAWTDRLVRWCEALFRDAYHAVAEADPFAQPPSAREPMLWAYLLDKTLYEVRYELGSRPHWAWIPLRGLHRLLQSEPPRTVPDAPATADA
ncbi:MAG: maltose alpha-D-glucosyltransferase [Bacteroidota bacterium]